MKELNIIQKTKCLTSDTLLKYLNDNLTNKENHAVEKHLLDCEMCQAQLDGLSEMKNKNNLSAIITDLDIQIDKRASKKINIKPFGVSKTQKRLKIYKYFAIAASFIILIGFSVLIGKYVTDLNQTTIAENINTQSETIANDREPTIDADDEIEVISDKKTEINEDIDKQVKEEKILDLIHTEEGEEIKLIEIVDADEIQDEESFEYDVVDDRVQGDVNNNTERTIETDEYNVSPSNTINNNEVEKNKGMSPSEDGAFVAGSEVEEVSVKNNRKKIFDFNKKTKRNAVSRTKDDENSQVLQERNEKARLQQEVTIDSGMYFYDNQQYTQAVDNFNTVIQQESTNSVALYYTAQCYQQTNDNRNALVYYNKITDDRSDEFYYNAQYNKALVLIDMGKERKATTILQELANESNLFQDSAKVKLLEIE